MCTVDPPLKVCKARMAGVRGIDEGSRSSLRFTRTTPRRLKTLTPCLGIHVMELEFIKSSSPMHLLPSLLGRHIGLECPWRRWRRAFIKGMSGLFAWKLEVLCTKSNFVLVRSFGIIKCKMQGLQ